MFCHLESLASLGQRNELILYQSHLLKSLILSAETLLALLLVRWLPAGLERSSPCPIARHGQTRKAFLAVFSVKRHPKTRSLYPGSPAGLLEWIFSLQIPSNSPVLPEWEMSFLAVFSGRDTPKQRSLYPSSPAGPRGRDLFAKSLPMGDPQYANPYWASGAGSQLRLKLAEGPRRGL